MHGISSLLLSESLEAHNSVEEFSAGAEVGYDVEVVFVAEELEDPDDVGMVQLSQNFNLS